MATLARAVAGTLLTAATLTAGGCIRGPVQPPASVILISIDTCRADALGCYGGSPEVAPNLDRLAAGGVLFENAVSPVPITLPAHCSLMTGVDPTAHGVHYNLGHLLHPRFDTLAELLAREGFATAAFVSSLVLDHRYGLDQGFGLYQDDLAAQPRNIFGAERPGTETVALAASWLRRHSDRPFFLFVHLYEPHEPYQPPPEHARRFPQSPYLAEVAAADDAVGRLLAAVDDLGVTDSTAVLVVGDHGEMLGEHGEETHTYFVYRSALRIPFIVSLPNRQQPARVASPVGLVDVAPTVAGLLGLPPMDGVDGIDLSPILDGREPAPRPGPILCESFTPTRYGANPLLGLVGARWKYIHTTRPELYDLSRDPAEARNLVETEPEVAAEHRGLLATLLEDRRAPPGEAPTSSPVDPETERRLAALGYASSPLDTTLRLDPSRPDPKDLIAAHVAHTNALQLIADGQFGAAEPLSRQVLTALPDSWEANLTLGKVAVGLGRWSEAIPLLERSLDLKPGQYDALRGLGQAYTGVGLRDRATDSYRRALALAPEPPRAAVELACALLEQGADDEADAYLARVAAAGRGRPAAVGELAGVLEACGHPDRAAALRGASAPAAARD